MCVCVCVCVRQIDRQSVRVRQTDRGTQAGRDREIETDCVASQSQCRVKCLLAEASMTCDCEVRLVREKQINTHTGSVDKLQSTTGA